MVTRDVRAVMLQAAEAALEEIVEEVRAGSVEGAPVGPPDEVYIDEAGAHPGALRASARVDYDRTPSGVTGVISFNTPYAARQHEELTWRHPQGGHAKYLERELTGRLFDLYARIGQHVDRALKG
jgi:hypothetical protein